VKPSKSRIVEIPVWNQVRKFLTDRADGVLPRPEKFCVEAILWKGNPL
jgi:hypothetical protein